MLTPRLLRPGHADGLGGATLVAVGMYPRGTLVIPAIGAGATVLGPIMNVVGFNAFMLLFTSTAAGGAINWLHLSPDDGVTTTFPRPMGNVANGQNTILFGVQGSFGASDIFAFGQLSFTALATPITLTVTAFEMSTR